MAFNLVRHARRPLSLVLPRMLSTTAVRGGKYPDPPPSYVYPTDKDYALPKIGSREVVGYGQNGMPEYSDLRDYPMPGIRFREETTEIKALREKEKDEWADLTIDEKKKLYRHSYCSTFAEFTAPTGEWKNVWALTLAIITITGLYMVFLQKFAYLPLRHNTEEHHEQMIRESVMERRGPIKGMSSQYDFEKKQWK